MDMSLQRGEAEVRQVIQSNGGLNITQGLRSSEKVWGLKCGVPPRVVKDRVLNPELGVGLPVIVSVYQRDSLGCSVERGRQKLM